MIINLMYSGFAGHNFERVGKPDGAVPRFLRIEGDETRVRVCWIVGFVFKAIIYTWC